MFYIKLNDDMELVITVREAIHRGDHLNQKLPFLVPLQVGDIDPRTSTCFIERRNCITNRTTSSPCQSPAN